MRTYFALAAIASVAFSYDEPAPKPIFDSKGTNCAWEFHGTGAAYNCYYNYSTIKMQTKDDWLVIDSATF
jgi:hypothetical protein